MANNWRHILENEAAEIRADMENSAASRDIVQLDQQSVGRLSRMDALQNQAMASAHHRNRQARLKAIDAALARLATDEFGYCVDCGDDIEPARLEANPCVLKCRDCASG